MLSTCPEAQSAARLARALVDERLAACVNWMPGVHSLYRWNDQVEETVEVLLIAKTTADRFQALSNRLRELHPYQVPEVLAVPCAAGLVDYLHWVHACTRTDS